MIKFVLVLYFDCEKLEEEESGDRDDLSVIADGHLDKVIEMPAIPRVGELVFMGNHLKVEQVVHIIAERKIEVHCDVGLFDALAAFAEDTQGWTFHLRPAGEELFFRRLKEYEAARERT